MNQGAQPAPHSSGPGSEPPLKGPASPAAPAGSRPTQTIRFRVRYAEADAMGYLHHSRFFQYFEAGRIELLRSRGVRYADLERQGIYFVVVRAEAHYRQPARHDDEIDLTTTEVRRGRVKIEHEYELRRDGRLLATAKTTIACIGRDGKPTQVPDTF